MKRFSFFRGFGFLALAMTLAVSAVMGQTGTTSLHGVVTDKTGAAIAGATVTVLNASQGLERKTLTGSAGEYEFLSLPPGTYTLRVEMVNFQKYEHTRLQLLVNSPTTENVSLSVGATTQTVEVSAQAVTLNTTDASLGNAFNETQVKELPLEGRNVPDLLSLQPGVTYTGNRSDVPTWDTRNGAVNGARSDQSNVTLDGVAVNDEGGHAFTSVLPVTLDSVQEFRVTTTNYNADQGSTSGAQVALVTKSGTNSFHGSAYEYNRNTYTSANDYFVKAAQIDNCLGNGTPLSDPSCNKAPKLIRNIFGGSLGGPIKKDRFYFFGNFEATRRAEAQSQTDVVPSATMRDGIIQYLCADAANPSCQGGSVTGLSGKSYAVQPGYYALSPGTIAGMDPLHIGPNQPVLQYLNTWPAPNSSACGDGFNYACFNFSAPISDSKNEYIAKLDYNITKDAKHRVSVMGALRNDNNAGSPFYPGLPPSQSIVNYNKGIVANYSGVLTNSIVNNFRYGFVRESVGTIGNSNQDWIYFRGLNDQAGAVTRTHSFQRPTHTLADDVSWIRGKHTWQFGTQISFIRTPSLSYASSFSDGSTNASWTSVSGYAQKNTPLTPQNYCPGGQCLPAVDASFANSYDFPLQALMGMVTEVDGRYNFQRDGSALPDGAALQRRFAINSYEFYGQDTWKVTPNFTVTLGLRWSLFSPPWETNKLQVSPTVNLDQFYLNRGAEAAQGIPSNQDPLVAFDWSGPANGRPGYYNWDKKDFGPRIALAWAPKFGSGLLGSLLGENKTSIRAGFGMVYDRFGQNLVDDFNQSGSFGLSTELSNPAGYETPCTSPRVTDIHTVPTMDLGCASTNPPTPPQQILLTPPPAVFPETFPTGTFYIGSSIDKGLKTPYAYTFDLSIARELKSGFSLEVSYVGRLSHRLLMQLDGATPLNLKDPKTGVDYFTAVTALAKIYRQQLASGNNASTLSFNPSQLDPKIAQYWTDMIQPLKGPNPGDGGASGLYTISSCTGVDSSGNPNVLSTSNPVIAAYDVFCGNNLNETTGLLVLDYYGIPDFNNVSNCGQTGQPDCNLYFPSGGQFSFYNPQFATLYMWRSMGTANYNAMQVSLKHKLSHGVQFDFNYTFSKSIDLASDAERVGTIGGNAAQIQNAWSPYQFRAVSDFDATHQFNADWVADLPFGRNRWIGRNASRALDAAIGGWQLSGLFRLTSGLPFYVTNGYQWPTDWDLSGNAIKTGPVQTGTFHNPSDASVVSAFANFDAAQSSFREPFPGEAGQRNNLRGPGYFSLDMSLGKRWQMPWSESHSLQLRWEVFNVLNAVRFDPLSVNATMDFSGSTFGQYTRLSTNPRVMQFALRYEF
ncbi:MAG TPA: TonB-dependent receptor [Bryobacteraceae bacterium]|nr:TonB-dependent receptor [Bryobacteraceae bacterium]